MNKQTKTMDKDNLKETNGSTLEDLGIEIESQDVSLGPDVHSPRRDIGGGNA